MKKLYLIRGVSGSGKTTFAKTLCESLPDAEMMAQDDYFYDKDGNYNWKPEELYKAVLWHERTVERVMNSGTTNIILHNTFTREKDFQKFIDLAEKYGYNVTSIVMENRHGNESVHGLDEKTLDRQERRMQGSIKLR